MTFVNGLLAETFSDVAPLPTDARGIMHVWKVTIRASEATGHTLIIFHSLAGGAEARPKLFPRRGSRIAARETSDQKDVASTVGDQPEAAQVIPLHRRAIRRALGKLSNAAGMPSALLAIEVMADGTINRLGETRGSTNAASEAMADAISGGSLATPRHAPTEAEKPPIGAWIERLGKQTYWVGPTAFFQTNTPAAELMLREIQQHLPTKMDMLIDAHAGVGTFALAFANRAKHVLAFEPDAGAVTGGQWTARSSYISNVEFHKGTAETLLPKLAGDLQPQVIILDPRATAAIPPLLPKSLAAKSRALSTSPAIPVLSPRCQAPLGHLQTHLSTPRRRLPPDLPHRNSSRPRPAPTLNAASPSTSLSRRSPSPPHRGCRGPPLSGGLGVSPDPYLH